MNLFHKITLIKNKACTTEQEHRRYLESLPTENLLVLGNSELIKGVLEERGISRKKQIKLKEKFEHDYILETNRDNYKKFISSWSKRPKLSLQTYYLLWHRRIGMSGTIIENAKLILFHLVIFLLTLYLILELTEQIKPLTPFTHYPFFRILLFGVSYGWARFMVRQPYQDLYIERDGGGEMGPELGQIIFIVFIVIGGLH